MALSATFTANFASFYAAVDKADAKLKDFGEGADKVGTRLNTLSNQFSGVKIVQEATLMAKAVEEIGGVSALTEKELKRLGATTNEAVTKMKQLGMDVPKNIQKIADETKDANKASVDWMGTLTKMAGAIGIGFSIGAVVNFVGTVFDAAEAIKETSDRLGVSIEAVQRFKYAVEQSGGSVGALENAIVTLNKGLAEGDKSTVRALGNLNLNLKELQAMTVEQRVIAVTNAIKDNAQSSTLASDATILLGKSYNELKPAIEAGIETVGKGTKVIAEQTVKDLAAAKQRWKDFWDDVVTITANALGFIIDANKRAAEAGKRAFEVMSDAQKEAHLKQEAVSKAMLNGTKYADEYAKLIAKVGKAQTDTNLPLEKAAPIIRTVTAEEERAADAARKLAAEIATHNQLWKNRIILLEAMEHWNRQVQAAEDQRRAGVFQAKVAVLQLTDAEQAAMRVNAAALVQRADQITSLEEYDAATEAAAVHMAYLARVSKAESENATGATDSFADSIGRLAGAFAQLGQIQGGGMGDVFGQIGQAVGTISLVQTALGNLATANANITAGKTVQGTTEAVSAGLAVAGAYYSAMQMIVKAQDEKWNLKVLRNNFIRASGGLRELQREAERAGVSLDNLMAAGQTTDVENAIKHITEAIQFQDDAMATLIETAERYGFTLEELGPALQRQELDKQAQGLYQDWQLLNAAGIESIAITDRMGESVSAYVQDAIAMGTEIPAAMRPMLEAMAKSGDLLDENGVAITDLEEAGIDFSLTMSQGFKDLIGEVRKLTEAISRELIPTIADAERAHVALADNPAYRPVRPGDPSAGYVQLQHGTGGFRNFGAGTPVMLHGWEAVVPRDEANATVHGSLGGSAGGASAPAIIINAQGAFFDTPDSLQRLANKVGDALTAKYSVMGKLRAAV